MTHTRTVQPTRQATSPTSPGARGPARVTRLSERFRFPCGHLEAQRSVQRRVRMTARHAWIACQRCGVIALVIDRGGRSGPGEPA